MSVSFTLAEPDFAFTLTDEETGIVVGVPDGVLPEGATMDVNMVEVTREHGPLWWWLIGFYYQGEQIRPDGDLTYHLPHQWGADLPELFFVWTSDTEAYGSPAVRVESDFVVFESDHTGNFSVMTTSPDDPSPNDDNDNDNDHWEFEQAGLLFQIPDGVLPGLAEGLNINVTPHVANNVIIGDYVTVASWDIGFTYADEPVQPSAPILITLPVPPALDDYREQLHVYRLHHEGAPTRVSADDFTIETNQIGVFAIAAPQDEFQSATPVTIADTESGVTVVVPHGVLPGGTELRVAPATVSPVEGMEEPLVSLYVEFSHQNEQVHANDLVTMRLPIPTDFEGNPAELYVWILFADDDEPYEWPNVRVEGNLLAFETRGTGVFSIVEGGPPQTPPTAFTLTCENTGIVVNVPVGVLPNGTELNIEDMMASQRIPTAWRVGFRYNNEVVSPNGAVTIRLPIPASFANAAESPVVRRFIPTGESQLVDFRVEGNFLVFEASTIDIWQIIPGPTPTSFTLTCPNTDSVAVVPVGVLPQGTTLQVGIAPINNAIAAWAVRFVHNNQYVQPNGQLTMRLPIPESFTGDRTALVVRHAAAGHIANVRLEGIFLVFETNREGIFYIEQPPLGHPIISLTCPTTGVIVRFREDVLPQGTTIQVTTPSVLGTLGSNSEYVRLAGWAVRFSHNNQFVRPVGSVTMLIPIPATFTGDRATIQVWHQVFGAGGFSRITNVAVEGNFLVFGVMMDPAHAAFSDVFDILAPRGQQQTTTTTTTTTGQMTTTTAPCTKTTVPTTTVFCTAPTTTAQSSSLPSSQNQQPPPQTGMSMSTSAIIAVVVLLLGGAYSGWRYFKKEEA